MRHRVAGYKLGRTASHRKAMTKNMMNSLIEHERITTTVPKAKHLRPYIEKMITIGKTDTQANRRRAFAKLRDKESVKKLFGVLGPRFAEREGGYCRILKLSKPRLGDAGEQAIIEFVERTLDESPPEELAKATEELAAAKA
jgi:large subunit ribosomal protein L17